MEPECSGDPITSCYLLSAMKTIHFLVILKLLLAEAFMCCKPNTHFRTPSRSQLSATCYQLSIKYCTGCRWSLRSFWMAQELLTTFDDDHALQSITLIPSKEGDGRFFIRCHDAETSTLLWDRKANGGFPEMKEIKQIVRDQIDPERYLGHSDSDARKQQTITEQKEVSDESKIEEIVGIPNIHCAVEPTVSILYCTGCRWMLRAAYYGQELLYTFDDELKSVTLIPGRPPTPGGVFTVALNDDIVWDRKEQGRFPEVKELKQQVRDRLNPLKNLGHSDLSKPSSDEASLDDDEAERSRKFFGVA